MIPSFCYEWIYHCTLVMSFGFLTLNQKKWSLSTSHSGNVENHSLPFVCLVLINWLIDFKQLSAVSEKYLLWCKRKVGTCKQGEIIDRQYSELLSLKSQCWLLELNSHIKKKYTLPVLLILEWSILNCLYWSTSLLINSAIITHFCPSIYILCNCNNLYKFNQPITCDIWNYWYLMTLQSSNTWFIKYLL